MKIYKTADRCVLHKKSLDDNRIYVNSSEGNSLFFDNGKLSFENYEVNRTLGRFFCIGGKTYRRIEISSGDEITYLLINGQGEELILPQRFIKKMSLSFNYGYPKRQDVYVFRDFNSDWKLNTIVFNCLDNNVISESLDKYYSKLMDGFIYGYDDKKHCYIKRDIKLNKVWEQEVITSATSAISNIKSHNTVVSFIGPEISQFYMENTISKYKQSGGTLIGFNDDNGDIMWQLPIPEAIDDIGLYHGKIYVGIYNKILIVDPQSGDVVKSIATNTSLPGYRVSAAHIFVDDSYIYFTHAEDELLLIYDLSSYALLYTVPMPTGYRIKGHQFTDPNTGKHYFTLDNRTQDVADFPSLEVDPLNLSTQIEFEKEPEKTIELVVVASDELEHEIVINMHSSSLDDALRFGEIYTRDSASHHGFNHGGRTYGTRQPTPTFNGVIRFILSGCDEDQGLVLERLAMMEKRFTHWNEHEILGKGMYACTDKFKPVQLITKFNA
ncbi:MULTISPECIES: hypothetical protein [unclassified Shewanella]|uniref:hypothetical protein n=1 Tax=unclassified Shewanella TaxID=196818 RepID=UPI0035500C94